jgi:hypothetical protein
MRVYVPYTKAKLCPETVKALEGVAQFVELPESDFHAYRRYFIQRWNEGEPFINVEHDVAPRLEQLQDLWSCPHHWCSCGYHPTDNIPYFGCVKFSAGFIRFHRGMWTDYEATYDYWWGSLDAHLARTANPAFRFHVHPWVWHKKHATGAENDVRLRENQAMTERARAVLSRATVLYPVVGQ